MNNDDFVSISIEGYIKHKSTNPMECDHDYITVRLPVPTPHNQPQEYGEFCDNCNARLDGVHGIIHYNQKFKYQERMKVKQNETKTD